MYDSLLDLFLDDYNVTCKITIYKNELDKNGKQTISNVISTVGRFFEVGSTEYAGNVEAFLSNSELYVPCDVDPSQRVVTSGYVEMNGKKYDILKVQKADIFNEINFTRLWLR